MLVLIYVVFIVIQVLIANLHNPMHVILMEAGLTYFGMPMQGRSGAAAASLAAAFDRNSVEIYTGVKMSVGVGGSCNIKKI
eukprot:COSAG01_NODE_65874_length_272_cov_0.560694_1_plen_80_part_10